MDSGINLGTPNMGVPVNTWGNIADAINQGIQQHQTLKEHQQDRAVIQQENQLRMQQYKTDAAQARLKQLTPTLLSNPAYQKSPQVNQMLEGIYKDIGLPVPRNADGTLDLESFKTPVDIEALQKVMSLPAAARKPQLDALGRQFSGITPDMYTAQQAVTPREQAIIDNLKAKNKDLGIKEDLAALREKNREIYQQNMMGFRTAEGDALRARVGLITSEISKNNAETAAIPQRLAILQQNANTAVTRADALLQSRSLTHSTWNQMLSSFRDIQGQYNRYFAQTQDFERLKAQLESTGVPDDDPRIEAYQQQEDAIKKAMGQLSTPMKTINDYMSKNVNDQIAGNTKSLSSGKPSQVVGGSSTRNTGTDPNNYDIGAIYIDGSGKRWKKRAHDWIAQS